MTRKKSSFIIQELKKLYPETPVPLNHKDPYTLLIAVLLSLSVPMKGKQNHTCII